MKPIFIAAALTIALAAPAVSAAGFSQEQMLRIMRAQENWVQRYAEAVASVERCPRAELDLREIVRALGEVGISESDLRGFYAGTFDAWLRNWRADLAKTFPEPEPALLCRTTIWAKFGANGYGRHWVREKR